MNISPPRAAAAVPPLRVHLRYGCPIVRAGLAAILSSQSDFQVSVDEAGDGGAGRVAMGGAGVVVADYAAGMALARQAGPLQAGDAARLLILTERDKEWEVRRAVDSGVHGYLLHGCLAEELIKCVRLLGRGSAYLSETAMRSVVESLGRPELTRRELDVLQVLARGGSDKVIARELGIGTGTVKSHIKHLLEKLDASARTHAVVVAIERGLLSEQAGAALPLRLGL